MKPLKTNIELFWEKILSCKIIIFKFQPSIIAGKTARHCGQNSTIQMANKNPNAIYLNGHIEVAQKIPFQFGDEVVSVCGYQLPMVRGQRRIPAPVTQICRCSCDSQTRLWQCKCHTSPPNLSKKFRAVRKLFGGVLFVFHMKNDDEEFSDDLKNSPKTFLDSPEKNPSFRTPTLSCH